MEKVKNTNSPDSTNLEISDDLDCGIIQTFASVRYSFTYSGAYPFTFRQLIRV